MDSPAELEHIIGYNNTLYNTLHYHPIQKSITCHCVGNIIIISDITDPHKQVILRHHDQNITSLDISLDGNYIVSGQMGSPNGLGFPVSIWDYHSKKHILDINGLVGDCENVKFSPDGKLIAAYDSRAIYVFDALTGELMALQKVDKNQFTTIAWGNISNSQSRRNPTYILASSAGPNVYIHTMIYDVKSMRYNMISQNVGFPSRGFSRKYSTMCFDSSNQYFFCGTNVGDVVVFNVENAVYRTNIPIANSITSLNYFNGCLYIGSQDGFIKIIKGSDSNWVQTAEVHLYGGIMSLTSSNVSNSLLAYTSRGKLYDLASNLQATEIAEACATETVSLCFGSRNDQFATLSENGNLRVWDVAEYNVVARVDDEIPATCFTYDGTNFIVGYKDGSLRTFSSTGTLVWNLAAAHRDSVTSVAANDKFVITAGKDCCIRVWNKNRQFVTQFAFHNKPVISVRIDVNRPNLIHSCAQDRSVCIFDLKTERLVVSHQLNAGQFTSFTQRPDAENEIVTTTSDGRIIYWDQDIIPNSVASINVEPACKLLSGSLSNNGRYLAVGCDDCTVKIYDASNLTLIVSLLAHSGAVKSVSWSPDQRQLVSLGADNTLCVWNFYLD